MQTRGGADGLRRGSVSHAHCSSCLPEQSLLSRREPAATSSVVSFCPNGGGAAFLQQPLRLDCIGSAARVVRGGYASSLVSWRGRYSLAIGEGWWTAASSNVEIGAAM